jgi:hypothetical protein
MLTITNKVQYYHWGWRVQPCAGEVRRSGAGDGRQRAARSHIGGGVPIARQPTQNKGA